MGRTGSIGRRAIAAVAGAAALGGGITAARAAGGYVQALPGPRWSVTPFMARLPASAKPFSYVIHQKTLQPYDFTATVDKPIPRSHDRFVSVDIATNYAATCPDGKPDVVGQEPKHKKVETKTSLSDTVTVFVEKLGFLGSCSSMPTRGSVTLVATAKTVAGKTWTSQLQIDLEP